MTESRTLFAAIAARYWLQVFPVAWTWKRRLLARARLIPDPLLREDALVSHRDKSSNTEGLAALAVLAPPAHRAAVVRSLVAYQLMLDYLDGVSERPCEDPIANGLCLHRAFEVALDPDARHDDYYALAPARDDGGYLLELIETCRAPLAQLPSYAAAREPLLQQARLCRQSQAFNHALHLPAGEARLEEWAAEAARTAELEVPFEWWELVAAAAASSLSIGALLALAATGGMTAAEANQVEAAYFPWASGLNALLDSLVDMDEDSETASHLRRYKSPELAAERLAMIGSSARERLCELPDGELHEAILAAMGALYLACPECWDEQREGISRAVFTALGPCARPSLLVHVIRRGGRGSGALRAAGRRGSSHL